MQKKKKVIERDTQSMVRAKSFYVENYNFLWEFLKIVLNIRLYEQSWKYFVIILVVKNTLFGYDVLNINQFICFHRKMFYRSKTRINSSFYFITHWISNRKISYFEFIAQNTIQALNHSRIKNNLKIEYLHLPALRFSTS